MEIRCVVITRAELYFESKDCFLLLLNITAHPLQLIRLQRHRLRGNSESKSVLGVHYETLSSFAEQEVHILNMITFSREYPANV
jgi:hypothetical protein